MVNFSNKIRAAEHMLLQAQLRPGGLLEVRQSRACHRMPYCHRSARASPASKFCMARAAVARGLPPCCERGQRGCDPMGSFGEDHGAGGFGSHPHQGTNTAAWGWRSSSSSACPLPPRQDWCPLFEPNCHCLVPASPALYISLYSSQLLGSCSFS